MNFAQFLKHAWSTHPVESQKLLNEFKSHFSLIESNDNIVALAQLINHVAGEHLEKWAEGLALSQELKSHKLLTDHDALNRFLAISNLAMDKNY